MSDSTPQTGFNAAAAAAAGATQIRTDANVEDAFDINSFARVFADDDSQAHMFMESTMLLVDELASRQQVYENKAVPSEGSCIIIQFIAPGSWFVFQVESVYYNPWTTKICVGMKLCINPQRLFVFYCTKTEIANSYAPNNAAALVVVAPTESSQHNQENQFAASPTMSAATASLSHTNMEDCLTNNSALFARSSKTPFVLSYVYVRQLLQHVVTEDMSNVATRHFTFDFANATLDQCQIFVHELRQMLLCKLDDLRDRHDLLAAKNCDPNVRVVACIGQCQELKYLMPDNKGHYTKYIYCNTPLDSTGNVVCGAYTCTGCEMSAGNTETECEQHTCNIDCQKAFHYGYHHVDISTEMLYLKYARLALPDGIRASILNDIKRRQGCVNTTNSIINDNPTALREGLWNAAMAELPQRESISGPAQVHQLFLRDVIMNKLVQCRKQHCPTCGGAHELMAVDQAGGDTHVTCAHCSTSFCYVCQRILPMQQGEYDALNANPMMRKLLAPFSSQIPPLQLENNSATTDCSADESTVIQSTRHNVNWMANQFSLVRLADNSTCPANICNLLSIMDAAVQPVDDHNNNESSLTMEADGNCSSNRTSAPNMNNTVTNSTSAAGPFNTNDIVRATITFHQFKVAVQLRAIARSVGKVWFAAAVSICHALDPFEQQLCAYLINTPGQIPTISTDEIELDETQHKAAITAIDHVHKQIIAELQTYL